MKTELCKTFFVIQQLEIGMKKAIRLTATLHLESRLDDGIYQDSKEAVKSRDKELPCGPRNLLRMSRWYRARLHDLRISYGGIGMGTTRLFITTDDEQEYEISPVDDTAEAMHVIARLITEIELVAAVPN